MTTFLLSFASGEFLGSQKRLEASAKKVGVDILVSKSPEDLQMTSFFKEHLDIFKYRRGYGYWLWKPFFIRELLEKMGDDDTLIYSDAAVEILRPLEPLIEIAKRQPVVAFGVGKHLNGMWTKRDCFVGMNCDEEKFWNAGQWNGFFQVYRKSSESLEIVNEWLEFCCDRRLITDEPNELGLPNLPEFRDHRHDQSIFSLVCEKRGLEKFRDPSQFGNFLKLPALRIAGEFVEHPYELKPSVNSEYFQLLNHHREK